ncbi:MAG: sugar dehydrogenase complex small subunit [Mesorhizobium sp.]
MRTENRSHGGSFSGNAFPTISVTRRALLAGAALSVASLNFLPAAGAQAPSAAETDFFDLSRAVTEKDDLDPVTAQRIMAALLKDDPDMAGRIGKLAALARNHATAKTFKEAAVAEGLDGDVMRIVTAWYTGTVDTTKGSVVVAYKDALMYRPVADGLTVPTYCSNGPTWWTGLPPEISRMPVNNPKVL